MTNWQDDALGEGIAIIGMAGQFPGAKTVDMFWQNILHGVESVSFFTDEALLLAGVEPEHLQHPQYVKANALLKDIDLFDASFFGLTKAEAETMDPQQRLFLTCAWQACENAGYIPDEIPNRVGVYAGVGFNAYFLNNILTNPDVVDMLGEFQVILNNDKDHLATRVAYKLDFNGPAINVNTACSTSLVAIHLACQGLLTFECDTALAGGVNAQLRQEAGYWYQEGGIKSPDGHCRPFDAQAKGTVSGNGVGIVVLKRLADAIEAGDSIHAVIKGSAINNDGLVKVGYTAPSVQGQARVIYDAQAMAEVAPDTIGYVEAHGTATQLGDPIEVQALTQAFRVHTDKKGFCALGSVKSNIGHLDTAAGVAGFIKATLAVRDGQIPPSLHFETANPQIDFEQSPFYVSREKHAWPEIMIPRRAGVSSFGIGGTNAHVILEEAPPLLPSSPSRRQQLLLLSAGSARGLETAVAHLTSYLQQHPAITLADVAYTLQVGRRPFAHRCMVVCQDTAEAITQLSGQSVARGNVATTPPSVVFMFPGQGTATVGMGAPLYQSEPIFREAIDQCAQHLIPLMALDIRHILYPNKAQKEVAERQIETTAIAQPAIFVISYALARLWQAWGIQPHMMIGHSIGEYVAACLAGVFSLEDALKLVAIRGQLMQTMPAGAMVAVTSPIEAISAWMDDALSVAAINGSSLSVISGPFEAIDIFEQKLQEADIHHRRLHTSHAFHSSMMMPIVEPFAEQVGQVACHPPQIPVVSTMTGQLWSTEQPLTPTYWGEQIQNPVKFMAGLDVILATETPQILLEVGPGESLNALTQQHPKRTDAHTVLSSLPHPKADIEADHYLWQSLGQLWVSGLAIDWVAFYGDERRYRVPLPTYPFDYQSYWLEPQETTAVVQPPAHTFADSFYIPVWKQTPSPRSDMPQMSEHWLLFMDEAGLGQQLVTSLQAMNQTVTLVTKGSQFVAEAAGRYRLNPTNREHYTALVNALSSELPTQIIDLWAVSMERATTPISYENIHHLLFLAQAFGGRETAVSLSVITNGLCAITGDEALHPLQALSAGASRVIPQEYPSITGRCIDVVLPPAQDEKAWQRLSQQVLVECRQKNTTSHLCAYRGWHRWGPQFDSLSPSEPYTFHQGGNYLLVGQPDELLIALVDTLLTTAQAKVFVIEPLPNETVATTPPHHTPTNEEALIEARAILAEKDIPLLSAEITDEASIQMALTQLEAQGDPLHGVFYMVEATSGGFIQQKEPAMMQAVLDAKVKGPTLLQQCLSTASLDFFVLFSAIPAITGGLGLIDYCAANTYADAFAHAQTLERGIPTVAINWEPENWQTDWQSKTEVTPLTPAEKVDAIQQILATNWPQVIVSGMQPLADTIAQVNALSNALFLTEEAESDLWELMPELLTVANIETMLREGWQEIFGEEMGVDDNFFELGGYSLLAIQLITQLNHLFQIHLSLTDMFENPTIAGLANLIVSKRQEDESLSEIESLLAEIEGMSSAEVEEKLTQTIL